jgi:hypothetical protein
MSHSPLFAAALLAVSILSGCATKDLGRQGSLSNYEREAMTCQDIDKEMTRVVAFVDQVNKATSYRWYDIPAVMENRWVGNREERSAALESANNRMIELWTLRDRKQCTAAANVQPLSLPVLQPEIVEQRID